jgi:ATP-binding cassette subfamily B protein
MPDNSEKLEISDKDAIDNPMRRLYVEYVKYQRLPIFAGLFGSLISRILDLLPPLLLAVALDTVILNERAFGLPLIPDDSLPSNEISQLYLMLVLIGGSFLFASGFHWGRNWGWNALAQRVQHNIRVDAYDAMQDLGMPFFANHQTGEMMSVLSNDANQLERFLNDGLNSFFRLLVMVIGIAGILVYLNWQLALVALLSVPILLVFTVGFIRTIQPKYEDVRSSVGDLNSRLENNIGGMRIIKVSTTEDYESDRVEDESDTYLKAQWGAIKTRIKFFPGLRLVSGFGFTLTFALGGLWVLGNGEAPFFFTGELSPGDFVVFVLYTQRFVWPVAQFGQIINKYQRARASARRLLTLIHRKPHVEVPDNPANVDDISGRVEYDSVSFGYREDETVIDDVSFEAEEGETIALAGPTGAGKSTILKLLLRMYDVDKGSINIDSIDLSKMSPKDLRENIGYVSQSPFLFEGTIAENIDYGVFGSERKDIVEATKMAEAHGFIDELNDGYDTYVGERGVKLSGGQRQRIAIARAILQDPNIMILDEATSDVDTETELLIQQGLNKVTEDRTTFAIAHRLSTIKDADKILVIEDGNIVEQGQHDELLENGQLYANLWHVQTGDIDMVSDEFIEKVTDRRDRVDKID